MQALIAGSGEGKICMIDKVFLDTNIIVYSVDRHEVARKKKARELIRRLNKTALIFISTQVLQEFFVAATRKLGMDPLLAKDIMRE